MSPAAHQEGTRARKSENPRDVLGDPTRCTAGFGENGEMFFCQREAEHDGLHRHGDQVFGATICGGSGDLPPAALAELEAFATHLKRRAAYDACSPDCRFCKENPRAS